MIWFIPAALVALYVLRLLWSVHRIEHTYLPAGNAARTIGAADILRAHYAARKLPEVDT